MTAQINLTPETVIFEAEWYNHPLTVGRLREVLADLPADAVIESGYYGCFGVFWNPETNIVNIANDE